MIIHSIAKYKFFFYIKKNNSFYFNKKIYINWYIYYNYFYNSSINYFLIFLFKNGKKKKYFNYLINTFIYFKKIIGFNHLKLIKRLFYLMNQQIIIIRKNLNNKNFIFFKFLSIKKQIYNTLKWCFNTFIKNIGYIKIKNIFVYKLFWMIYLINFKFSSLNIFEEYKEQKRFIYKYRYLLSIQK